MAILEDHSWFIALGVNGQPCEIWTTDLDGYLSVVYLRRF